MPTGRYAVLGCGKGVRCQGRFVARIGPCSIVVRLLLALIVTGISRAGLAAECRTASVETAIASPSELFQQIRGKTDAQVLNIGMLQQTSQDKCIWIYDVRLLTAAGAVVDVNFAATDLAVLGAEGPDGDSSAAALLNAFGLNTAGIGSSTSTHGREGTTAAGGTSARNNSGGGGPGAGGGSTGPAGGSAGPGPGGGGPGGGGSGGAGPGGGPSGAGPAGAGPGGAGPGGAGPGGAGPGGGGPAGGGPGGHSGI